MSIELYEDDWRLLIMSLTEGNCVLLLGPDIPVPGPDGDRHLESELTEQLARRIGRDTASIGFPQMAQTYGEEKKRNHLEMAVKTFYESNLPEADEPSMFRDLAALPFQLIVTSRHDYYMEQALIDVGRTPIVEDYNIGGGEEMVPPGTADQPVLYYLYGRPDAAESLVLTEDDLLRFLMAVVSGDPPLPSTIKSQFTRPGKMFLFLGFGLRHWYVRVILHALGANQAETQSYAVEGLPETQRRRDDNVIGFYKRGFGIDIISGDEREFVSTLCANWSTWGAGSKAPRRTPASAGPVSAAPRDGAPRVFISYASEDEPQAKALYDILLAQGLDPWWDKEKLRGGDDWHAELHQHVAGSDYFVVLQTPNLKGRKFSYVNQEIGVALEKQARARHGVRFIIPIATDTEACLEDLREIQTTVVRTDDDRVQLAERIWELEKS